MKKLILIIVALFIISAPVISYAQKAEGVPSKWKKNFASPTYGMVIFPSQIEPIWIPGVEGAFDFTSFPTVALDLRIFRGVNVARRGGFYTGVETGALVFLPMSNVFTDTVTVYDRTYTTALLSNSNIEFNLDTFGGIVFLMAKYGLRIDIGIALFGLGIGAELGMGASLYSGGFEIYVGNRAEPDASVSWGSSAASMGLIVDTGLEAALRLGRNFRLVGKAGLTIVPVSYPVNEEWDSNSWVLDSVDPATGQVTASNRDILRYALSNYNVKIDAFGLGARFGFVLNF